MRIFLDANVIFSAVKSNGAVRTFLAELKTERHTLVADGYVVSEARRNLEIKFPEAMTDYTRVMEGVEVTATASDPLGAELAPSLPKKDQPVLAAAFRYQCHILLTGDKTHFGPLYGRGIEGVEIHSPASLANKLGAP